MQKHRRQFYVQILLLLLAVLITQVGCNDEGSAEDIEKVTGTESDQVGDSTSDSLSDTGSETGSMTDNTGETTDTKSDQMGDSTSDSLSDTGFETDTDTGTEIYIDTDTDMDTQTEDSDTVEDSDTTAIHVDSSTFSTAETSFTVVLMPDTQNYAAWNTEMFFDQTNWIRDQQNDFNIRFVAHEGDVVGTESSLDEWEVSVEAMDVMYDRESGLGVPFGISFGNHDYYAEDGVAITENFNTHYPLSLYESMDEFGGEFEEGSSNNIWFTFSSGGTNVLMLFLEMGARDEVLQWALNVLNDHPDHIAMMTTHSFLNQDDEILGDVVNYKSACNGYGLDSSNCNDGWEMWQKLVEPAKNLRFVFSGHIGTADDGAGNAVMENSVGLPVYMMFVNFQYWSMNSSGQLRLLEFKQETGSVLVSTYSPTYDSYLTDPDNFFEIIDSTLF